MKRKLSANKLREKLLTNETEWNSDKEQQESAILDLHGCGIYLSLEKASSSDEH